jgi:hypothetical protein
MPDRLRPDVATHSKDPWAAGAAFRDRQPSPFRGGSPRHRTTSAELMFFAVTCDVSGHSPSWLCTSEGSSGPRAVVLGQFLAYLAYRHAGSAGGGAGISDCRVQGVLPEVIGLPPGDLVKQVRLRSAA